MRYVLLLAVGIVFIGSVVNAQYSTDVYPVEVVQLSNQQRLNSFFWRFEQRIKAHDPDLVRWAFDTLVLAEGMPNTTRPLLREIFWEALRSDIYPDSVLLSLYAGRINGYMADFNVLEVSGIRSVEPLSIGDTITCEITISTGLDDSTHHVQVTVKKVSERDAEASSTFRIIAYPPEFMMIIRRYAEKFAVLNAGEHGGLSSQLRAPDWEDRWDFIRNGEKACIEEIDSFKPVDDGLVHVPITVWAGNEVLKFDRITRSTVMDQFGTPILDMITDFYVVANNNLGWHRLMISDRKQKRLYLADLGIGLVTSNPGYKGQNSWGYNFTYLTEIYYDHTHDWLYSYDQASDKIQKFTIDPIGSDGGMFGGDILTVNRPQFSGIDNFAVVHAETVPPGQIPTWSWTLLLSGIDNSIIPFLEVHFIQDGYNKAYPDIRYVGVETPCGREEFSTAPILGAFPVSVSYGMDSYHIERLETTALAMGSDLVIAKNRFEDANDTTVNAYLKPINWLRFKDRYELFIMGRVERLFDGTILIADRYQNAVHIVEPEDGKYVCTLTASNFFPGTKIHHIRSVRYLPGTDWQQLFDDYEDLYISEWWTDEGGLSRYLFCGKVVSAEITRSSALGNDQILTSVLGRVRLKIQLLDSGLVVSEGYEAIVNTGEYLLSVANPNRYDIRVLTEPASNIAYGSYAQLPTAIELPVSGTPRVVQVQRQPRPSDITVTVWPTVSRNLVTLELSSGTEQLVTIQLVDLIGRVIIDEGSRYIHSGSTYVRMNVGRIPQGMYHLVATTGSGRVTKKIIVQ